MQFIPSKPDKYWMKFFLISFAQTKFCYNSIPYLGAQGTKKDRRFTIRGIRHKKIVESRDTKQRISNHDRQLLYCGSVS